MCSSVGMVCTLDNTAATYRYRQRIQDAIGRYTREVKEAWEVYECPVPITQDCAARMINAWGTLRVAWAKADQELTEAREDCLQAEQWADDGGRNVE